VTGPGDGERFLRTSKKEQGRKALEHPFKRGDIGMPSFEIIKDTEELRKRIACNCAIRLRVGSSDAARAKRNQIARC